MPRYFEAVLTDAFANEHVDEFTLSSANFPGIEGPEWEIRKYALKGGKQHGVDVVELDNGCMTVAVVPTRGMGILEAYTDAGSLGWGSPVRQVVHPAYVNEESHGMLGWLEGFNEFICRCGLSHHGAPGEDVRSDGGAERRAMLPLHGTIANTPAVRVAVRVNLTPPHEISVVGEVQDARMFGPAWRLTATVSTVPGRSEFEIADVIENTRAQPAEMELLYHCNYGRPLLGEGARIVAPVRFACPRDARARDGMAEWDTYGAPEAGFAEQCYYVQPHADRRGRTMIALVSPDRELAGTVRYNARDLPCLTIWKNTAAEADGYVTGLEPGTDYPNPRRFEREKGRVVQVPPGGTYAAALRFGLVAGAASVAKVEKEIAALARGRKQRVCADMHPDYCPM